MEKHLFHCVYAAISEEAQKAALLAGQPAAAVVQYLLSPDLLPRAIALGSRVTQEGFVQLTWGVAEDQAGSFSFAYGKGSPLPTRPTSPQEALNLIEVAQVEDQRKKLLNRGSRSPLTPEERAILTPEQAAEWDAGIEARRAADARDAEQRILDQAKLKAACEKAEAAVKEFEAGGLTPDELIYGYDQTSTSEYIVRVRAEVERRRIRRTAQLLGESGLADARFWEHSTSDHPLGLLLCEEATNILTDWILPTVVVPEYVLLVQSDVDHNEDCELARAGFISCKVEGLKSEEYRACEQTIRALRQSLPLVPAGHPLHDQKGWPSLIRRHTGTCKACGGEVDRLGIEVKVGLGGGVEVEREYGVEATNKEVL